METKRMNETTCNSGQNLGKMLEMNRQFLAFNLGKTLELSKIQRWEQQVTTLDTTMRAARYNAGRIFQLWRTEPKNFGFASKNSAGGDIKDEENDVLCFASWIWVVANSYGNCKGILVWQIPSY